MIVIIASSESQPNIVGTNLEILLLKERLTVHIIVEATGRNNNILTEQLIRDNYTFSIINPIKLAEPILITDKPTINHKKFIITCTKNRKLRKKKNKSKTHKK